MTRFLLSNSVTTCLNTYCRYAISQFWNGLYSEDSTWKWRSGHAYDVDAGYTDWKNTPNSPDDNRGTRVLRNEGDDDRQWTRDVMTNNKICICEATVTLGTCIFMWEAI